MSRNVPGHVWPSLKFWYCLAFVLSPSWVISFLAMDFVKKTTPLLLLLLVLILTIFLLYFASICVLLKFYIFPQTNRFFRGYTDAKKIAGYAVFLVACVGLNYFPEKSVASMLTFISLSLYSLCTLLCIQPHTDFGAFEFLLGGSVTQAFKCFGAHSPYSWFVLFACIVIFSIRYGLKPKQYSSGEASSHEHQDHVLHQLEAGLSPPPTPNEDFPLLGARSENNRSRSTCTFFVKRDSAFIEFSTYNGGGDRRRLKDTIHPRRKFKHLLPKINYQESPNFGDIEVAQDLDSLRERLRQLERLQLLGYYSGLEPREAVGKPGPEDDLPVENYYQEEVKAYRRRTSAR